MGDNEKPPTSKYPPVAKGHARIRYSILGTQTGGTVTLAGWIDLSRAPLTNDEAEVLCAYLEKFHSLTNAILLGWNEVQR